MTMETTCGNDVQADLDRIIRQAETACRSADRILIYGRGDVFHSVYAFVKDTGNRRKLVGIVDDNPAKWRVRVDDLEVSPPDVCELEQADLIIFTFPDYRPILKRLGARIDPGRILEGHLLDYALTVTRRSLNTICWLITTACNSRCTICGYWKIKNVHLDPGIITETINSYPQTNHYLTGGEPFCHPQWFEILAGIRVKSQILVVTNGLRSEQIWRACDEFGIRQFCVSLNGGRESYKRIRGVDGYDRTVRTIRGLADRPGTMIIIPFVLSPFTTRDDFLTVEALCRELNLSLAPLIYRQFEQFDDLPAVESAVENFSRFADLINESPVVMDLDRKFYNTYLAWHSGKLTMPCTSGFTRVSIDEHGEVSWCTDQPQAQARMGNLYQANLQDILRSERFDELAEKYYHCNGCWNRSFRRFDFTCYWNELQAQLSRAGRP